MEKWYCMSDGWCIWRSSQIPYIGKITGTFVVGLKQCIWFDGWSQHNFFRYIYAFAFFFASDPWLRERERWRTRGWHDPKGLNFPRQPGSSIGFVIMRKFYEITFKQSEILEIYPSFMNCTLFYLSFRFVSAHFPRGWPEVKPRLIFIGKTQIFFPFLKKNRRLRGIPERLA